MIVLHLELTSLEIFDMEPPQIDLILPQAESDGGLWKSGVQEASVTTFEKRSLKDNPIIARLTSIIYFPLAASVLLLVAYGLLICYSAVLGDEEYDFVRQVAGVAIGCIAMLFVWAVDYKKFANFMWVFFVVSIVLILSPHLPFIGRNVLGATSYIYIGVQVQPGEFAKVSVALFAASLVARYDGQLCYIMEYLKCLGLLFVPFICIMTQPDLGTGLVYLFLSAVVLVIGGARLKYLIWTLVALIILVATIFLIDDLLKYELSDGSYEYVLIKQYQRARLLVFLNQGSKDYSAESYNLQQAMIAIGSGGIFGKGFASSTQSALGFLPEAPTDFIFCVLAEEFGFVGVLVLLALFCALVVFSLRVARQSDTLFGTLIVSAVIGMWLFQILENIGMCCGLMPITGIPLPFMSYGSSFMVVNFIMLGLIGSVYSHKATIRRGVRYANAD